MLSSPLTLLPTLSTLPQLPLTDSENTNNKRIQLQLSKQILPSATHCLIPDNFNPFSSNTGANNNNNITITIQVNLIKKDYLECIK